MFTSIPLNSLEIMTSFRLIEEGLAFGCGFFKADVKVGYRGKHKYHYFTYAANKCKGKGGV
jgi:hypothetical protein